MSMNIAGTLFAMVLLFILVFIQLVSHITGCRGLSAPVMKAEEGSSKKPLKRYSLTTRDLFGNDLTSSSEPAQATSLNSSNTSKAMEL